MEGYVAMALEIVKAQAGFRTMTEEEICSIISGVSVTIRQILTADENTDLSQQERTTADRTPKENSILCLECLKPYKMLTHKHMTTHGLTPLEYRNKWGYTKDMPLVCKSLQRRRRKKMKDIRLWEKRKKTSPDAEHKPIAS